MASLNKVQLIGRLGKDAEVRTTNDSKVANFTLATDESYKNKSGERITTTEWHKVVVWRGLADVVEKYTRKGSLVYVEGKIRTRSYDGKDGNKVYTTEIIADSIELLDKRESGGNSSSSNNENHSEQHHVADDSKLTDNSQPNNNNSLSTGDDLPF